MDTHGCKRHCGVLQVEAIVKRNHERAADALRALLPALHRDMLRPPEAGPSNGASLPEIQVHTLLPPPNLARGAQASCQAMQSW
jgi:hypothetical protein